MNKLIIHIIFSVIIICNIKAEDIKVEHYNKENGLSHNSVRHIIQDKLGILWLGTFNGLNSFDGQKFTPFMSDSGHANKIQNDDITALVIDNKSNTMWIGTRRGLTKFDMRNHQFTTFLPQPNDPKTIPDSEIRAIHIDKTGRIWIGTKDCGLFIYDESENSFKEIDIEGFNYVKTITEDINGNLWVGSFETGGVARLTLNKDGNITNTKRYNLLVKNTGIKNPYLYFIFQDDKSDIFIGTREGLFKWNKQDDTFDLQPIPNTKFRETIGPYFTCVTRSADGKYWLGTIGGIIVCNRLEDISKGEYSWYFSKQSEKTSLVDNSISALFFDNAGLLWIGTDNGLDKYDPFGNQFKTFNSFSMVIDGKIPRISDYERTYDNKLIVATHNSGLFVMENGQFKPIVKDNYEISSIFTPDGKIFYCGLWNGNILIYNHITKTSKLLKLEFKPDPIIAFATLDNGDMVIGSHGNGAIIFNPTTNKTDSTLRVKFPSASINQIAVTNDNTIWLATENGVIKYNTVNQSHKVYTAKDGSVEGLTNSSAKALCIDNKGKLWVSTRMGLNYYSPDIDDFIHVNNPRELKENWITDILKDSRGDLWFNFNNGHVGRFTPASNTLLSYNVGSGNRLDIFSSKGFMLFNDSIIYITGKDEIIYFSINDLKDNLSADPPFISEVKIQNKTVWPGEVINGQVVLKENINYSKNLELKYVNRNFTISFSSPSYANPRLNKYAYILEGFDDEWITTDNNATSIQYTNLYPGEYTFKIKYANSSGFPSDISEYRIVIKPPFWLTYKALAIALILISAIVFLVYRQLKKSWTLKHELLLEKVQREREETLNNEKLRLFTNISHELRTPISLILGPAKQLSEDDIDNDQQKKLTKLILQNSTRLYNLVNQLLDFRKAQNGELTLKVSKTNILGFTRDIFDSFTALVIEKNINYKIICEHNDITGWIDSDKYNKILSNLLSNAIKFTNRFGNIELFVDVTINPQGQRTLVIEVSDDGVGIPEDSINKIFARFYQVETTKNNHTGTGIGLSLVKSLVNIHKSEIKLQSTDGEGSTFTVKIPIDRESYSDNEIFDYEVNYSTSDQITELTPETDISDKEKILIIEDNKELRDYIADYLSEYYTVFKAENGEEGLQICRSIRPIICIADVMMPVMNGFEFCETLKNDERISHIPVVLLTDNENQIKGYKSGADGYLTKPFDPTLLKTFISNIIRTRTDLKKRFSADMESNVDMLTHSPVDEEFLNKLTAIIEKNISDPNLAGSLLCSELGVSSSTLYRRIKELTDLSPNEFIRTIRLKKAVTLLKSKRNNVSEVADMVGFNDPYYFSRCFKKQFGFPPSEML